MLLPIYFIIIKMATFEVETVRIPAKESGLSLDTWFYKPMGSGPFPVVIAGHGFVVYLCEIIIG
jgi:hypothetical protein